MNKKKSNKWAAVAGAVLTAIAVSGQHAAAGWPMVDPKLDDLAKPWCYFVHPVTCIGMPWQPEPIGIQVTPEGDIYTANSEFCLFWGDESKPLACRQRQFLDGYVPVVSDYWTDDALRYDYEVFCATLPCDEANKNTAIFAKLTIRNTGGSPVTAKAAAAFRHNGGPRRQIYTWGGPPSGWMGFNPSWMHEIKDNQLLHSGQTVGIYPAPSRWEAVNGIPYEKPFKGKWYSVSERTEVGIAHYEKELATGETMTLVFKFPRVPTADAKYLAELKAADYATVRQQVVEYWRNLLTRFSLIHTPGEPLIENSFRATAAHVMLATRTYGGEKTQTDGLPYPGLFLTATYDYSLLYESFGTPDFMRVNFPHFTARQQPDGLFVDTSLSHGDKIFCGHGQPMLAIINDVLWNRDAAVGKKYFPAIKKGVECIINDSRTQPHGLMRASIPYDNEMIKGQYTCHNYWSLMTVRASIRLARYLGENKFAEQWLKFHDEYEKLVLKAVRKSAAPDGYVPTGLYEFNATPSARPGFTQNFFDQDWENEMLLWPTELVQPGDPLVTGSLKRLRDTKYREGIMTYREYLHQYITSRAANQYLFNGQPKEALLDMYHALLHGGSAAESFEFQMPIWSQRDLVDCPPPHAWGCSTFNGLVRNLFIMEQGGHGGLEPEKRDIMLLNAVSPAWLKDGEPLGIENAPTSFGLVTALLTPREGGADVAIKTEFHTQPHNLVVRIPYFVTLKSFTSDAKSATRDGDVIRLSPDATRLTLGWTLNPDAGKDLFQTLLLRYRREVVYWNTPTSKRADCPKPPEGFLTDAEKATPSQALSFKSVLSTWQHEYARRFAEYVNAGGKLHTYSPVPMQPATELKVNIPEQDAKSLTTGCPVTCSRADRPAECANDGYLSPDEFWESNEARPWWQVDLGEGGKQVSTIRVVPYYSDPNRYYQFIAKTSTDGTNWTTVLDMSANTKPLGKEGAVYTGQPAMVRYIRVEMLKNSANTGKHLVEVMAN